MTFLKKSLNYSVQTYLQEHFLNKNLSCYNKFLLEATNSIKVSHEIDSIIIPNNNKKFYLYIIQKSLIEDCNSKFSCLYFFSPDNPNENFYIETETFSKDILLFEGYLYKKENNKQEFLITDYLMNNNVVLKHSYKLRRELLVKNYQHLFNCIINDNISINIHQVLENINLIKIFKTNFIYSDYLNCTETVVDSFKKTRVIDTKSIEPKKMIIQSSDITEIYNVYEKDTHNCQGVLYIKTLGNSKTLKKMFLKDNNIEILCEYNTIFNKWSPIL